MCYGNLSGMYEEEVKKSAAGYRSMASRRDVDSNLCGAKRLMDQ